MPRPPPGEALGGCSHSGDAARFADGLRGAAPYSKLVPTHPAMAMQKATTITVPNINPSMALSFLR